MEPASVAGSAKTSAANYSVLPILFVPSDITPNPYGLGYIDQRMQLIQRWYAEQLQGKTFTLQPAVLVRGSQPLSYYYGSCYPPDNCDWASRMWDNTFADLPVQGYPYQSNLIRGVFFQHNGLGAPALGGGGDFLVALDADNGRMNADCLEPGCASSVSKGGAAHELGHAFGLPHTVDDPEGSPGISLMNYGFYNFPQATFVNTALNPERNTLYASPFLNVQMSLADRGFEDCLASWTVVSGTSNCSTSIKRSGLGALALSPTSGNNVQVRQQMSASQRTYDISAWINSPDAGNHHVWIQIATLNANAQVLSSQIFGDLAGATDGWQRIAYSFTAPAQTASLQVRINASGSDTTILYMDDVDVSETKIIPPVPLQMFYFDGDTINGTQPTLQWDDVTSATNYQVQVGANNSLNSPLRDVNVTSPSFQVPSGLSLNSRYFWRVRAVNGTGASDWSSVWSFITAGPQDYFSDEFENMSLNPSWSWIREDPAHWSLGGLPGRRSFGYMGITAQAGDLLGTDNSAKNVLLKSPPQGNYEISTKIDFWEPGPSINYQQAGLLIYQDDNNYLKLVRTYNNGNKLEWLAEVNGVTVTDVSIPVWTDPPIRIARSGNQYSAKYSVDSITWNSLGLPVTVGWGSPKIGLTAFSKLNVQQINAYFDYFRVRTGESTITGNIGVGGATLNYMDGTPQSVISQPDGSYSLSVSNNWSGAVTPTHPCYVFSPASRSYSNVTANKITQNYTPTFNNAALCAVTVGVFRPSNGLLYLKNSNTTGFADIAINYGLGGDYPVVGDWDGNGTVTIGIYRNGSFYLRNSNTIGFADMVFPFGAPGDQPIAGDWDGDGVDTIGIYRNGTFYLRNSNSAGAPEMSFALGIPGDVGIAGDWEGDGKDTTGVFRPSNGAIYLKNFNTTGIADIQINYGLPGDRPVTGDWNNDGIDTIGIYRNGNFYLRNANTIGFADLVFALGIPGDMPIAGNWDGLP
jgi:regulation of enolase protein 1 (concanavalin A-like superfamily)